MSMVLTGLFICLISNDGFSLFYIQFPISFFTIWYSCCQWASGAASAYWGIFCLLVAANGAEQHSNTNIRGRPSTSAWHIARICQLPRICWERRSFITSAHAGLMPLGKQSQGGRREAVSYFFQSPTFYKAQRPKYHEVFSLLRIKHVLNWLTEESSVKIRCSGYLFRRKEWLIQLADSCLNFNSVACQDWAVREEVPYYVT